MFKAVKANWKKHKRNPNQLSISGHFRELKRRIIMTVLVFVGLLVACIYWCNYLMDVILEVGKNTGFNFVYIAPQEVLIQQLRTAGVFALIGTVPVILFEITQFISPAFDIKHASLKLALVELVGLPMFALGVLFTYKILFPFTCSYLYGVGSNSGISAQISVERYVTLFLSTTTCIGLVFEIPLVSVVLAKFGLIKSGMMKKLRSVIIVVIFLLAAIITPPDVVSQMIVAIPMVCLYQISIFLCALCEKGKKNSV